MKLISAQRKHLESLANAIDPVVRIGKQGLESKIIESVKDAFNSHELIKIKLLDTAPVEAKEAANTIAEGTDSSIVRVIGRVIILYRRFTDKPPKIILPVK